MVRIYEYKREKRIEEIAEMLKEMERSGEIEPRKRIITVISLKYNVSRRTAADYLMAAEHQKTLI